MTRKKSGPHQAGRPRDGEGYVNLGEKREHQIVMEEHGITVPKGKGSRKIIHHIDGDLRNNAISNLEVVTKKEHQNLPANKTHKKRS